MNKIKYILFDAANTLIHKPVLWDKYLSVLSAHGYAISKKELKIKHKIVSEIIKFPDVTSKEFYDIFNKELLNAFGIIETKMILEDIFETCKYLPWEAFDDVSILSTFSQDKIGVLSNFNSSLREIFEEKLHNIEFSHVIISEEEKVAKPDVHFYNKAINKIGLQPKEILFIGDSLKLDIIPALQLGFNVKLIDRDSVYPASKYRIDTLKEISVI